MMAALAGALLVAAAPPAEAGKACNRFVLGSPCIKSSDLKARLNLDEDGRDAGLRLRDEDGDNAVQLDAASANVANLFSNEANESNGLVKAWARINPDGSVDACWRCNTDPAATLRVGTGLYVVDLTPLSTNNRGSPRSALPRSGLQQARSVRQLRQKQRHELQHQAGTARQERQDPGQERCRRECVPVKRQSRQRHQSVLQRGEREQRPAQGLVQIDDDGTILACWRCNTDPAQTRQFDAGIYKVDFTPLATDIRGPKSATCDGIPNVFFDFVPCAVQLGTSGDFSSAFVVTTDAIGDKDDREFILIIY